MSSPLGEGIFIMGESEPSSGDFDLPPFGGGVSNVEWRLDVRALAEAAVPTCRPRLDELLLILVLLGATASIGSGESKSLVGASLDLCVEGFADGSNKSARRRCYVTHKSDINNYRPTPKINKRAFKMSISIFRIFTHTHPTIVGRNLIFLQTFTIITPPLPTIEVINFE